MKKVIEGFKPLSGKHCVTTALRQILNYYGHPFSEEMLLGLGEGLYFGYMQLGTGPMLTGRKKVFEFEDSLAKHLGITMRCKAPKEYEGAFVNLKAQIDRDKPTLIYVDMPYLSYLQMPPHSHFGGHAVVVFGYDEEEKSFYISDRDGEDFPVPTSKGVMKQDVHLVPYEEVEQARSSRHRPFPPHHKYLEIDALAIKPIDEKMLREAIYNCAYAMLYSPAKFLGINGILKLAKRLPKWEQLGEREMVIAAITNSYMIGHEGGTGGGAFRKMYGRFLMEATSYFRGDELTPIGEQFLEVGNQWDTVGNSLRELGSKRVGEGKKDKQRLTDIGHQVEEIYQVEKTLYEALITYTSKNKGGE